MIPQEARFVYKEMTWGDGTAVAVYHRAHLGKALTSSSQVSSTHQFMNGPSRDDISLDDTPTEERRGKQRDLSLTGGSEHG